MSIYFRRGWVVVCSTLSFFYSTCRELEAKSRCAARCGLVVRVHSRVSVYVCMPDPGKRRAASLGPGDRRYLDYLCLVCKLGCRSWRDEISIFGRRNKIYFSTISHNPSRKGFGKSNGSAASPPYVQVLQIFPRIRVSLAQLVFQRYKSHVYQIILDI